MELQITHCPSQRQGKLLGAFQNFDPSSRHHTPAVLLVILDNGLMEYWDPETCTMSNKEVTLDATTKAS